MAPNSYWPRFLRRKLPDDSLKGASKGGILSALEILSSKGAAHYHSRQCREANCDQSSRRCLSKRRYVHFKLMVFDNTGRR